MVHPKQPLHTQRRAINLDNTANCPVAVECAQCGCADRYSLDASMIDADIGVACITLCDACAELECIPHLCYPHIAEMVLDHCAHLRIELDTMTVLQRVEVKP